MFKRLQEKWKVSGWRLAIILCTFALGGSLTGYAGRQIMPLLGIGNPFAWTLAYVLLVTLLWPLAVLLVSIPLGQYRFFTAYIHKIGERMGIVKSQRSKTRDQNAGSIKKEIAIFASGAGSNARKIIEHFRNHPAIRVSLVACNKPGAGVIQIARDNNIPVLMLEKEKFFRSDVYTEELQKRNIRFIVLAGFLWKVPAALIRAYPNRIVNIHPALLPAYGGKGMYGQHVHEAVISNKEKESGISIHYVDELYDHGKTIFQAHCPVLENDSPETLAQRIHELEHRYYPQVIEQELIKLPASDN